MNVTRMIRGALTMVLVPLLVAGCVVERCEWTSEVTPTDQGSADEDAATAQEP